MRIALCLSGYLRTFKKCWPSIQEKVIQNHDCDIFIHTYDKLGKSKGWIHSETKQILTEPVENPVDLGFVEFRPKLTEKIDLNFLEKIPNIKTIVVENLNDIKQTFIDKYKNVSQFSNIDEIANILYKIYKCNELKIDYEKEHNFKYDLVIRTRADQIFEKNINLDFPENKILINAYPWGDEDYVNHLIGDNENDVISDRFAAGSSKNIDILCDAFNNIENIFENNEINYSPLEYIFKIHLENNNIELEKRNLNFYVKHNPQRIKKI